MNYLDKFQQMIDEYNAGSRNVETFFTELVEFAQELKDTVGEWGVRPHRWLGR